MIEFNGYFFDTRAQMIQAMAIEFIAPSPHGFGDMPRDFLVESDDFGIFNEMVAEGAHNANLTNFVDEPYKISEREMLTAIAAARETLMG